MKPIRLRRKTVIAWTIALFAFLLILEIYLRVYWGFCDSVLMMESKHYEYIPQPNQDRFRFRNHVKYNSFSMRSPEPDSSAFNILGFGDSIINGGVAVDQDSLATTLLSGELSHALHKHVQVLNIGAGSWGPDNDYAYLMEKGNFNARMIFLLVSSHDAYDNMEFKPIIDKAIRYESRQYKLAIWELIHKYAIPRIAPTPYQEIPIVKNGKTFNSGFMNFLNYCRKNNLPFFIYLHSDRSEMEDRQYNPQGKEIINFCKTNQVECIQDLPTMQPGYYRGIIHMNHAGQKQMAANLYPVLMRYLNK